MKQLISLVSFLVAAGIAQSGAPPRQQAHLLDATISHPVHLLYLLFLPSTYAVTPHTHWPLILYLHGGSLRSEDVEQLRTLGLPQCSCSRDHELKGEIFIVTAGHEGVKLGLVEIRAFQPSQLNSLIDPVKKGIAEQDARLAPISKAAEQLESSAKQKDDDPRLWSQGSYARFHPLSDRALRLWIDCSTHSYLKERLRRQVHDEIATFRRNSNVRGRHRGLLNSTEIYYWICQSHLFVAT